ncbi:helix-turn-helix domain-containing protein [Coxiella burnetii]|uniref:Transcriptional regulator n=1 Tax=Coxiella burnetii (strain Dugway 5J108-111) TaxID=434922 RepID=A9KCG4_COXBN|nr:XRE family transcriptional regulator [Coxiella burnetii]ABS78010.1 transcriptional regulator [Coxiella burnetii Dugway 5J108-111]OYK82319.1 XRE family transcriptional regulator [Coxiella burnetii]
MSFFAERLKRLRQERQMSMQALADAAGVSKSMICKIESTEVQPTLDVAGKLAVALGKTLSEMLHSPQTPSVIQLTTEEQAIWIDAQNIKRRNISPILEGSKVEWLFVEFPPGASLTKPLTPYTPETEKYILITKGVLEVKINKTIYSLKKGDSLYYDGKCASELLNPSQKVTEYYVLIVRTTN